MNKKLKKIELEDYIKNNQKTVLNTIEYYGYSLTIDHIKLLHEISLEKNNEENLGRHNTKILTDLYELGLIGCRKSDKYDDISLGLWPEFVNCRILEKGSRLLRQIEERLNMGWWGKIIVPRLKKQDISIIAIILSIISIIVSILAIII